MSDRPKEGREMSELGDHWRERRERRQKARRKWHECPRCAVAFGGNGTKVPPGEECHNCGWEAPEATP